MNAPYDLLFASDSPEQSIWHGLPSALHAFGGLHHVPADAPTSGTVVNTDTATDDGESDEYERRYWPRHHWPAVTHSTVYGITYDVLNLWVRGSGIDKEQFHRKSIRWFPSHLISTWQAGPIVVELTTTMIDINCTFFQFKICNIGNENFTGTVHLCGDPNIFNYTCNQQSWGRGFGTHQWIGSDGVGIDKEIQWGIGLDFFPWFEALHPDDRQFRWLSMYYQMAFAIDPIGWQRSTHGWDNGFESWSLTRDITLSAGSNLCFRVAFAGRWNGRAKNEAAQLSSLVSQAQEQLAAREINSVIANNEAYWRDFFAKVPTPKDTWPDALIRLYYKAWTAVLYNTIAPTDMLFYRSTGRMAVCNKIGASTMATCPAAWESSLSALCLSLVDCQLAQEILEGVYQTIDEDGFISELVGGWRMTQLAVNEPFSVWACYQQNQDRQFLERIYPAVRKNLFYRIWHPTWKHHGAIMLRNYAYAHISAIYVRKMAVTLERPSEEIARIYEAVADTKKAIHAFWDDDAGYYRCNFNPVEGPLGGGKFDDGLDAATLIPIFRGHKASVLPRLVDLIRNEFLGDNGVILRKPKTLPPGKSGTWNGATQQSTFTLKESNLMFVYMGLKEADPELFQTVVAGTLNNIRKAGDFFECYDHRGMGRHNGPGSIFGAFAVIWGMLLQDGVVDWLYD